MALTLTQLRTVKTRAEWLTSILSLLNQLGFTATSWQEGSIQRTIIETVAGVASDINAMVAALSYLMFVRDASGEALTQLALSNYQVTRTTSGSTRGYVRLTGGASGPPHTVAASELVVSNGSKTYRNLATFTVNASSYVDVLVEAEEPGDASNVGNSTITTIMTPLAGVTCSNPAYGTTGTWITVPGVNEESDAALRERCYDRWSTLAAVEAISDRYEYVSRTELPNCRVKVDSSNPDGPGTIRIYLAQDDGVASGAEATAVNNAIAAECFGGPDAPTTPYHTTIAATAAAVAITGTVFYDASLTDSATCQTAVEAAVSAYINAAPIGGYSYGSGADNIIDRDGIIDAIRNVTGVKKVTLSSPSGDTAVAAYAVATAGTFTVTYTAAS